METRKIVFCLLISTLLYRILMMKYKYPHTYQLLLPNTDSKETWEFFSEFSNVKMLNPTILDYRILSESGTRAPDGTKDWEYSVVYTEHLVYLPFITTQERAWVQLFTEKLGDEHGQSVRPFSIVFEHETCTLGTCLNTTHSMEFRQESSATLITARVEYECQLLLSYYCKLEYLSQRALIHERIYATLGNSK